MGDHPRKSIIVSYSAAQSFLSSTTWPQILEAFISQLPLRNIHWKSASRTSIRTIQELDVSLINLDSVRDEHTSQVPATLLEKPLLNIFIVTCENTDIEAYRTTVKKQIKEWHATVTSRKNQEWLILHVVRPDSKTQSGAFFQLKGSVLDKVRADFNLDKRDRCVRLIWSSGSTNPAAWGEFITKLKDGVLSAFDAAVAQREEEVKRSESQRLMPGWNFCTFFILKESLATSFEGVTLFDESLLQYDELEASFYQVLKEKNLSWFGTLINPAPDDDSAPLLSITKKPYRDLILANTISVFDFRVYLLARQCELLAKAGRITEICKKVGTFLGALGRRLREVEQDIAPFFIESWIYTSALSVVEQCDAWVSRLTLNNKQLASLNAGKGELLELARNQLDVIGIEIKFLPPKPPFSSTMTSKSPSTSAAKPVDKISNSALLEALTNQEAFYELYILLTNRAIDMFAKAGRRKFALKLHGSLAALDLHRGRLDAALTTYTSLPAHYAPHMWTSLESTMLSQALKTHEALGKPKDREWIHILLSFLKTYTESSGAELLMREEEKVTYICRLVEALKVASSELESDLPYSDHPALSVQVSPTALSAESQDGSYLEATVHNLLPCALPIDEISVILTGRDSERLKFVTSSESIPPGKSKATLFCPTPSSGTFVLESSEIRMSHLNFQWSHRNTSTTSKNSRISKSKNILVRIARDILALDVRLRQPPLVELGKPPSLSVAIMTGRNRISTVSFKLSAPSVTFQCQDVILCTKDVKLPQCSDDCITLHDLPPDKEVEMLIPHSDVSAFHSMKVSLEVNYVTLSEPSVTRTLELTRVVTTTLPISVNVEDFFRGKRLFSKFTISTLSHQHVRIAAIHLNPPSTAINGLKIVACSPYKRRVTTVTPAQTAQFLFQIDSDGPVRDSLSLNITYRMLRQEVESVIEHAVEAVLVESPAWRKHRIPLVSKMIELLEANASWVELYGISGELIVPASVEPTAELYEPIERVKESLRGHRHPESPEGPWQEIRIPVDVPYMDIVAAARIQLAPQASSNDASLYAGQPISAVLTIHTTFHWGPSANDKERQFMMQYDVEEVVRQWLVSGKKRGNFLATDDGTVTVPLTFVALHHGEFALPKVVVTALPLADVVTMGSLAIPNTETTQVHGAEKVLILPRGGRSTFVVGMGST